MHLFQMPGPAAHVLLRVEYLVPIVVVMTAMAAEAKASVAGKAMAVAKDSVARSHTFADA